MDQEKYIEPETQVEAGTADENTSDAADTLSSDKDGWGSDENAPAAPEVDEQ